MTLFPSTRLTRVGRSGWQAAGATSAMAMTV